MDNSALYRLKNLNNHNIISVFKDQFKIGRATTNDLSIANNPYISSSHCIFEYDHGHLYVRDTSSNGTLINRSNKISKNDPCVELHSGDTVHIVFRKDEPESNVIFQVELPILNQIEEQSNKELSSYDEDTQMTSYPSIPPLSPNQTQENIDLSSLMNTSADVELKPTKAKGEPRKEFAMEAGDDMEDVLTCVCCQDIMSNPISLEPCLHAFCNDCYASWEAVQRTCPKCRVKVIGKKKNFVINGILEAYLKAYPHKRPTSKQSDENNDESTKAKTTKNEVGPDGMYLHNTQYGYDDYDDDMDEDDEMDDDNDHDDDDDDDEDNHHQIYFNPFVLPPPPPVANVRFVCRQCPPQIAVTADPTDFQCPGNQNHILCQCCIQPMPDRRDEPDIHQHCEICKQFFCNIYFQQCSRAGCLGCLNHLRDFNFSPRHLTNFVNDNPVESQIVQDYLTNNHKTIRDLLIECCDRLDRNEFTCSNIDRNAAVPSSKVVCYKCGLKMFKELVYQFRVHMKQDDIFPVIMRNRDNCYYGKRCRTQYTKIGHAQKLNHACEQIKF
ncbi:unnamed protein product [Rotaria sordida]|uniref:E3 ubiquitin-protein ligase CHFR n=1 Tax=Rotaria sordida TaxID=392033 RepID=A0A815F4C2_9BILA|nr:unnamed protein product [Rotaria sordida]CAF3612401.1 unnamed protein product [Rotaria sordida]CAF3773007.1 unnamed protein product [Rotaria sordida]